MTLPPRSAWQRAWLAVAEHEVISLARELTASAQVRLISLPQAGLALLPLMDGALGEPWYLGEIPLATCAIEVMTSDGLWARGAAIVMADTAELAWALAVLDAFVAHTLPGSEKAVELLLRGAAWRAREDERRRAILSETRVDFQMINEAERDVDA